MSTTASRLSSAELANLIGELSAGRNPSWTEQAFMSSAPVDASDGVGLTNASDGGAISTQVQIRMRRVAAYRTVVFEITVANSDTYSIEFDGPAAVFSSPITINYVSDGSATAQEIAEGLKAAIEANATLDANLLAYAEKDPTSGLYRLRVTGQPGSDLGAQNFEVASAGSSGAGDLTVSGDPMTCTLTLWVYPGGGRSSTSEDVDLTSYAAFADSDATEPHEETSPWLQLGSFMYGTGSMNLTSGLLFELETPGISRIACVITAAASTDGATIDLFNPRVVIGPCHRESTRPSGT